MGKSTLGAIGLGLALACLSGCQRSLAPARFVEEYEKSALVTVETGPARFLGLYQSPDYLDAKRSALGAGAGSAGGNGMSGTYFRVSFRSRIDGASTTSTSSFSGDGNELVLAGETLRRLQSGFARNVRLIDGKGNSLPPLLYHFERGYPPNPLHSLQFVFPAESDGKAIDLASAEVVIDEFGLNTGEVRLPCKAPTHLHLKVNP